MQNEEEGNTKREIEAEEIRNKGVSWWAADV